MCDYISRKQKLYKEATSNNSQPGQKAANINLAAQAGLMTTSIGNTALRNILLHMNIPAPARKSMQRNSNRVNDIITKLNEENMREQRGQIIRNNKLLGLSEKTPIMMEADCRYNNALTSGGGKTPFQPATQCAYTVCENQTLPKKNHWGHCEK